MDMTLILASIISGATPIVLATIGETISEKSGIINLSLDGTILLSAMAAFVIAYKTQSLMMGFLAAAIVGAVLSAIVAFFSLYLNQSQVAVGFVLTLMARDLAYFIGNPYSRLQGPQVLSLPIPLLHDIPFFGQIFFNQNITVYFSLLLIAGCWGYLYHTPLGLSLRSVGENPAASFARGLNPRKMQMMYAVCGGFLVGVSGAVFSLSTKPGWGRPQGAEGIGWIALALVIFGGWHPVKAAMGAYLFSFLQIAGIYLQGWFPSIPAQVFQVAPFPFMIFTLVLIYLASSVSEFQPDDLTMVKSGRNHRIKKILKAFAGSAPTSLGKPYYPE